MRMETAMSSNKNAHKRFNSPEHLDVWRAIGRFPSIHDALYQLIAEQSDGKGFLDLCCSTGLLGQRILKGIKGARVYGVDADIKALDAAVVAGITYPMLKLTLMPAMIETFLAHVRDNRIDVLVARRCMPELFGSDRAFGLAFVEGIAKAGVKEVFLQGRVPTVKAVNQLASIQQEIALFASRYTVIAQKNDCAALSLNTQS
jgi:SAM-dependent methyltransferase